MGKPKDGLYARELADVRMRVPTELQKQGGVWVLRTGMTRAKPGYDIGPKRIEHYSIHFVLEGNLRLRTDMDEFSVHAGDLFCMVPNTTYRYTRESDAPLTMRWVAFHGPQAAAIVAMLGLSESDPCMRGVVGHSVRTLLAELHELDPAAPFIQESALYRLFGLLRRERPDMVEPGATASWIERSAEYMRLHYDEEDMRVERLAERAGVHRSRFTAAFTQVYGVPPKRYLIGLRMAKATKLLRDERVAVQDVALSVGYPDLFAFTRAFTAEFGCPPTAYRQRQQGG
ncbi:AraC family transcriptional regulator [Paenibacillus mesophilus]|uniref:helix-turn-helix domain-containing protein n=1 Tax=Paenibacillus mesophilus TaxID=2582849 RepID=UPI00110E4379|nr:AraC family transcriptional regulator [Paenibacillus mesophilus]TMV45253.1 AraC family transcriptional regulator [Paenibacillus mesophilus]